MFPVYKISAVVGGIIKIFYSFNKASNEASNDSVDELPYPSNNPRLVPYLGPWMNRDAILACLFRPVGQPVSNSGLQVQSGQSCKGLEAGGSEVSSL